MPAPRRTLERNRDADWIDAENRKQGEKVNGASCVAAALRSNLASSCFIEARAWDAKISPQRNVRALRSYGC